MKFLSSGGALALFAMITVACGGTVQPGDASDGGTDVVNADRANDLGTDVSADVVTCGTATCAAGQACCAATGACYDSRCLACCMSAQDVTETDSTTDVPADAARVCTSASQCNTGEICVFATSGCSAQGVCMTDIGCGRPSLPYCGCDGVTFFDHCAGPASPWVSMGACPDAGVDASVDTGVDVPAVDVTPGADVLNDSGGGTCGSATVCGAGLNCCGGYCVNFQNDPNNCGHCGGLCTGATPMCAGGTCAASTCAPPCGSGSVCCDVRGPGPSRPPMCYVGTTCPVGCPLCV